MISINQLEVLLRSIPQYFLFGGLSLILYAWIEKKPQRGIWGELVLATIGIFAVIVLLSGMIPSPMAAGLVAEHVEMVIKMLVLLSILGILSIVSIAIRLIRKKHWNPLVLIVFCVALFLFFSSTKLAKIPFHLNPTETSIEK